MVLWYWSEKVALPKSMTLMSLVAGCRGADFLQTDRNMMRYIGAKCEYRNQSGKAALPKLMTWAVPQVIDLWLIGWMLTSCMVQQHGGPQLKIGFIRLTSLAHAICCTCASH